MQEVAGNTQSLLLRYVFINAVYCAKSARSRDKVSFATNGLPDHDVACKRVLHPDQMCLLIGTEAAHTWFIDSHISNRDGFV